VRPSPDSNPRERAATEPPTTAAGIPGSSIARIRPANRACWVSDVVLHRIPLCYSGGMSSFRFGELEQAARRAARLEGVGYSEFVRSAVQERTDRVLAGIDNVALLGDVIGCVDDPTISSERTGEQVRALLHARSVHSSGQAS